MPPDTSSTGPVDTEQLAASGLLGNLADAAKFLADNLGTMGGTLAPAALASLEWRDLRAVLQRLVYLMHCCGAGLKAGPERASALSTRTAVLQQAMSDAATAALQLWLVDSEAPRSLENILEWADEMVAALGDSNALLQRHGNFIVALMPLLRTSAAAARDAQQGADADTIKEMEELAASFTSGLHHCIYWLYGLRMDAVDEETWGGAVPDADIPPDGVRPIASKDDVLAVWPLVDRFLCEQSDTNLKTKHQPFLTRVIHLFPVPPPILQSIADAAWAKMASEDSPGIGTPGVVNPFMGLLEQGRAHASAAEWEKYLPVYMSVFHLSGMMQQWITEALEKNPECPNGMMDAAADTVIHCAVLPFYYDLVFNPQEYGNGWAYLAQTHHDAADLLLQDAAAQLPLSQWKYRNDLHQRLQRHRRLGHWCAAIAELCTTAPEEKADMYDLTGTKLYESLQNVPPEYDQLQTRPERQDPQLLAACNGALRAFRAAAEASPSEWSYQMSIGRCLRRLGRPADEYLPHLALACHISTQQHKGLIEPMYTLHAARLKMLMAEAPSAQEECVGKLRLVGRYCFSREAQAEVNCLGQGGDAHAWTDAQAGAVHRVLYADCIEALQWCLAKNKLFHRASTMWVHEQHHGCLSYFACHRHRISIYFSLLQARKGPLCR